MRQLVTKTSAAEKAARLARDGALDAALKQYGDLFAMYPSDWSVANALGDLYVRMGRTADAAAHFVRVAEQLEADGYTAKARAVYRKVLRMQPGHELANARVAELETRHLETGVVVNRAIAAARDEFGLARKREEHGGAADDQRPVAPLPLTPVEVPPSTSSVPLQLSREQPDPPAGAAQPPPLDVPASAPLGNGWPSSVETALPGDAAAVRETARRTPTFEELLDRLDPDRPRPSEGLLEQALDDLDPVLPSAAGRPVAEALDGMDPAAEEIVPIHLDVSEVEALDPVGCDTTDPCGDIADGFDAEDVEACGPIAVDSGDSITGAGDEESPEGDAAALDLEACELVQPDFESATTDEEEEEEAGAYDLDAVQEGSEEEYAQEPEAAEETAPLAEADGGGWEAYTLNTVPAEPVATPDEDHEADELDRLLQALEEQTRAAGRGRATVTLPDTATAVPLVGDSGDEEVPTEDADECGTAAPSRPEGDNTFLETAPESEYGVDIDLEEAAVDGGSPGGVAVEPVEAHLELADVDSSDESSFSAIAPVADVAPAIEDRFDPTVPVVQDEFGALVPAGENAFDAAVSAFEDCFDAAELQEDEPALDQQPIGRLPGEYVTPEEGFEEIRIAVLDSIAADIRAGLARADDLIAAGEPAGAVGLLHDAMCSPPLRHAACARLARVYRETGDIAAAMECLEWAAEREPVDGAAGHELAYELALTLEAMGQRDHALGIYRELLSEVGPGFRDVAARASHLAA